MSCSCGSTNSILLNSLLSLELVCLVCKHRGGVFPLEIISTQMRLFLLCHFIHTDFMTTFEDTFDTQTKLKILKFPRSKTNTHLQPHESSDTAMKCSAGKLQLLSSPNSSSLISAAGLISAVCPLTELRCIILPGTEHLHSTDLLEKNVLILIYVKFSQ